MLFNTSECGAEIPQRLAITRSNLTRLFPPAVTHTSMLLLLLSDGLPLDCISNQLMHFYLFLFFFLLIFHVRCPLLLMLLLFSYFFCLFFFFFLNKLCDRCTETATILPRSGPADIPRASYPSFRTSSGK